jgi:HSP20 family molecular chaperone IbpA
MGSPTSIWSQVYNMGRQLFKLLEEQCFSVRETEDSLRIRLFMFGLDKEDVNITVDHNTLTIKGLKQTEEGCRQVLSSTYDLTGKPYKIDQIKAKIKNGCVLKIVVPKMKEDVKINVKIQDCREEEEE